MTSPVTVSEVIGGQLTRFGRTPVTPPTAGIVYGCNAGGADASVASRLSDFGREPMNRWYYGLGNLPATFNTGYQGGSPEKRVQVSFKWLPSEILAGAHDATFDGYFSSAPSDWSGLVTYWHEPNSEISGGTFTYQDWQNATIRLSNRLLALGVTSKWQIAPNFTGPYPKLGINWSDNWMITPDRLHPGARQTWDIYGNPYGGLGLDSQYPDPAEGLDSMFTRLSTFGWWNNWGITEFNSPRRNWDTTEAARVTWLDGYVKHALTGGNQPPKSILLWEGSGVKWPQFFYTSATKNWWAGIVAGSA